MKKLLVVVDMQNDFVSGALGTKEAVDIVPYVVGRVVEAVNAGWDIVFTQDTHTEDYMDTQEGKNLPVPHCIRGSEGWAIIPQLQEYTAGRPCVEKPTFGSVHLANMVALMEACALELARDYLAEDQTTVGAEILCRPKAPTPVGMKVTATARLREIERRKMWFDIEVHDENGKCGEGTHLRIMVPQKKD